MQDEAVELGFLSSIVETIFQSLAYGLFVVLALASTRLLVRRGWRSRQGAIMLGMIWSMLILSTLEWTMSVVFSLSQIAGLDDVVKNVHPLQDLMTAVGKINYGIADAVLIWRVWVLCKTEYRIWLRACSVSLILTYIFVMLTIIFRLACNASQGRALRTLTRALDISQVGMLMLSTITNLLSTGIVGIYVWKFRKLFRTAMSQEGTTMSLGILLLIVESGVLYTAFVLFSIVGSVIRVPTGTIGDVSGDVLIHIAGVYPTIVITLAKLQGRLTTPVFTMHPTRVRFETRPHPHLDNATSMPPYSMNDSGHSFEDAVRLRGDPKTLSALNFTDFGEDVMTYMESRWEQV